MSHTLLFAGMSLQRNIAQNEISGVHDFFVKALIDFIV